MIFKGFKFGMLLQLAVGPVCLFIFSTATTKSFASAESAVVAVTLIDAVFIALAVLGIVSFINKDKVKLFLKFAGAFVIALFGLKIILESNGIHLLPDFNMLVGFKSDNSFVEGLFITASNPLTILFWAGVFSNKVAKEKLNTRQIYTFGIGAVLSTFLFLTVIAVAGYITNTFISNTAMNILNILVGGVMLFLAFRVCYK